MGQVVVTTERTLNAGPDRVLAALGDYTGVRSRILTEHFSEYDVREGGQGEGTVVHWKLAATSKRVRDCLFTASTPGKDRLVERDANSSMVTTWTVSPPVTPPASGHDHLGRSGRHRRVLREDLRPQGPAAHLRRAAGEAGRRAGHLTGARPPHPAGVP